MGEPSLHTTHCTLLYTPHTPLHTTHFPTHHALPLHIASGAWDRKQRDGQCVLEAAQATDWITCVLAFSNKKASVSN